MSKVLVPAVKLLLGMVLFVGLPLLGWGVTDGAGFFANPARAAYVVVAVVLQIAAVIAFPNVGRGSGEGQRTMGRQRFAVLLLQLLSLAMMPAAGYSDRHNAAALGDLAAIRYPGLVLFALGFVVMVWTEAALGRQFSIQVTLQEGHRLVTNGPYRYVRHPHYLGIIVFNTGIALVFRSWLALVLMAALTLVLLWRIGDEERLMHEGFGDQWEAYAKRSWRLIPFVY